MKIPRHAIPMSIIHKDGRWYDLYTEKIKGGWRITWVRPKGSPQIDIVLEKVYAKKPPHKLLVDDTPDSNMC